MRLIIKSYIKSYFKNVIEAFGLIIFMIIIMAVINGILAGVVQYYSRFSAIEKVSEPWNYSLEFKYNNKSNNNDLINNDSNNFLAGFVPFYLTDEDPKTAFDGLYTKDLNFTRHQIINRNSNTYQDWFKSVDKKTPRQQANFVTNKILTAVADFQHKNLTLINSFLSDPTQANFEAPEGLSAQLQKFENGLFVGNFISPLGFNFWKPVIEESQGLDMRVLLNHDLFNNPQQAQRAKNWSSHFFNNIYLSGKNLSTPSKNRSFLIESINRTSKINDLKIYSGRSPTAASAGSPNNEAAINDKLSVNFKNAPNSIVNIPNLSAGGNYQIKITGNGITLDTVVRKTTSTTFGSNASLRPTPVANYTVLYTNSNLVNTISADYWAKSDEPQSQYSISDASEFYYKASNGVSQNDLNQIFSPAFAANSGFLTYKQSPVSTNLQNIFVTLVVNLSVSAVLIVLGFIFINFTMKKEMNKTRIQLGIFKAFGYQNRELSWIFALKFLITTFIGAGIGFACGIPLQQLSAEQFVNNVLFPFNSIYLSPIFLSFFFIVIPLTFTLISYLLNYYYIKQPIMNLIRGNQKARIPLLARAFRVLFSWSSFTFRVQGSFTFKAFGKYLAVMLVFFISSTLFLFTFSAVSEIKSLTKNLFIQYNKAVDHTAAAAPRLTASTWDTQAKELQLNFTNGNTAYLPTPKGVPPEGAAYHRVLGTPLGLLQAKMQPINPIPAGAPPGIGEWGLEKFTYTAGTAPQTLYDIAKNPTTAPDFIKNLIKDKPLSGPQWSMLSFLLMTGYTTAQLQSPPFGNIAPTSGPQLTEARKIATQLYSFLENDSPTEPIFNDGLRVGNKFSGSVTDFVNTLDGLNMFGLLYIIYPKGPITATNLPVPVNLPADLPFLPRIYSSYPATTTSDNYRLTGPVQFLTQFLPNILSINNPSSSYFTFNSLYYDPASELPTFDTTMYPQSNITKEADVQGIPQTNWNQFYNFPDIDVEQIFDDQWKWNQDNPTGPVPVIVSQRMAKVLNLQVNSVYDMPITQYNNPNPTLPMKVVGVLKSDVLSNNIYMSAANLKQLYIQKRNSPTDPAVPLASNFYNNLVSKKKLINTNIPIKDFLAGKVRITYNLQNIGLSLLNTGDMNWGQVLNISKNPSSANGPPSQRHFNQLNLGEYDSKNLQALLVDPPNILPISLLRNVVKESLGKVNEQLALLQTLNAALIAVLLLVVVVAIIDESTGIILTMKALGYRNAQVNYIVIGNYLIGVVVMFVLAVFVNIGLWVFLSNLIFNLAGILLPIPLGYTNPLICFGIIMLVLLISWVIALAFVKRKPLNVITADS